MSNQKISNGEEFNEAASNDMTESYKDGANAFRKFVRRPERYKNEEHVLRIKLEGKFGGWRLREDVYQAFLGTGVKDFLFINDVNVLGRENNDVERDNWLVDCFAVGSVADWIDDQDVTQGDIIEGKFKFAYELVKNGANTRGVAEAHDSEIANLILLEGYKKLSSDDMQDEDDSKTTLEAENDFSELLNGLLQSIKNEREI